MKRTISLLLSLSMLFSISALPIAKIYAAPTNLIPNPSVETPNPTEPTLPLDWTQGSWGTNAAVFSYLNGGAEDGSYSVQVQMTSYTSGDAKWYFNPVNVTAGDEYHFNDYYMASVPTEVEVQFQDASGDLSYQDLGIAPASSTWTQYSNNFTVPSGITELTVFHLIDSVGTLQTDNFSLTTTSAPSVSLTAPTASSSLSGTVNLAAEAADTNGIASVQFNVDGTPVGSPITAAPYQYNWNTLSATNGAHSLSATATNIDGISTTSAAVAVTVDNVIPPGTNLIPNPLVETPTSGEPTIPNNWSWGEWGTNTTAFNYLTNNSGYNGSDSLQVQTTSYTSGDGKWYFVPTSVVAGQTYTYSDYYESSAATDVQAVYIDGSGNVTYQDLGTAAAASAWTNFSTSFTVPAGTQTMTIYHLMSAVGSLQTSDFSLTEGSLPTVSLTSPLAAATVSGNVTLSASASADGTGIASVQFDVDGIPVGAPVTISPYQYVWDSLAAANGAHTVTATAISSDGESTTSAPISITVDNKAPTSGNLIINPKVKTADLTDPSTPADWSTDNWGTNQAQFSYLTTGYNGSDSLQVQMTSYTSGDGKWYFNAVKATKDEQYKFSEDYESNVNTEVDAVFNMTNGTIIYQIIGLPQASAKWDNFTTEFSAPVGTKSFTIYHLLQGVGTLTTSDFSLTKYTPVGFNRALLTLTFDDGYVNQYTETMPLLKQYGYDSTQFIITDLIGTTGYLDDSQIDSLYLAGNEIASHTVTHDNLTLETPAQLSAEMAPSQATLESITGAPVTDMAYPYGLYDNAVVSATEGVYAAARGVEDGLNSKDNFNPYDIKVQNVFNTTTTAQVADWVAQAQATDTWLVLVYHSVDPDKTSPIDGGIYNVTPTQLKDQLVAIKSSGITVETMQQALSEITPQL